MIQEFPATAQEVAAAVAKIGDSHAFRGRETPQRLLSYLADRTLDGSAEALKEYTIGVEVFGKPTNYDPQEDASVRVQIGRLRQKLEEYYRTEGVGDSLIIELPKRQFALQFHPQSPPPEIPPAAHETALTTTTTLPASADELSPPAPPRLPGVSWPSLLVGAFAVALLWAGWSFWQTRAPESSPKAADAESLELSELWQPFLASNRPVTMAMTMRPFLRYDRGMIWEWGLVDLPGEEQEARLTILRRQLNTRVLVPWERTYTSFGEATGVFLLTRLFEGNRRDLRLKRSDTLTWEEITESDVIFVGSGKYGVPFDRIPVKLAFEQRALSIVNLHPQGGEAAEFITPSPAPPDFLQTEDYALISLVPGLHGKGEMLAFGAGSSSGLWAAVQYMTDPRYAPELVSKLKAGKGTLPKHYQVVIRARFQSLVPIEISYVTHREL
ncbi:MAG: hypothetical protein M3Q76_07595 [Acidobacteriota bacterium]|nr:hypothetical protein [Acidobacteriota bacterium]